jgi:hypothetical protein
MPAELDPAHEQRYQQYLQDALLDHQALLTLLAPDAHARGVQVPLLPEGQITDSQVHMNYDSMLALDFLAEDLYRQALPQLDPGSQLPAVASTRPVREVTYSRDQPQGQSLPNGPISVLTRNFGTPRINNPRLEALDPELYRHKTENPNWVVKNLAYIAFRADVRRGGNPFFVATIECPIYVTEPTEQARAKSGQPRFVRVQRSYIRTPQTTRQLKKQGRPAIHADKAESDSDEW